MEATIPAIRARMEMFPNTFELRLFSSGSSTMSRVATTVRMISGRKRMVSAMLNAALAGTRDLRAGTGLPRSEIDAEGHVYLRLLKHARGRFTDRWKERLRIYAHPYHHGDQRNYGRPLAPLEIEHVVAKVVGRLPVEDA